MRLGAPPSLADLGEWERLSSAELERAGIGDGLPLARVTAADVERTLAAAGLAPDEVVASLPPLSRPATAASLAICALLAGCEPIWFPVVLAGVEGIAADAFNGLGVFTTTGTAAVAALVNGPAAAAFNSGGNLLGPGARANATVGRALSLIALAVGGAVPGVVDMATMGQPGKYTFCFAENEQESPWEPLHVALGYPAERSAVTVFAAAGTSEVTNAHAATAEDVLETLAASLYQPGTLDPDRSRVGGGRCAVLISPEWAALLAGEGLSRAAVCEELAARASWPVSTLPPGLRRLVLAASGSGARDGSVNALESASDVLLAVAGGVGIKQTVIAGWAGGSLPVTALVRGPGRGDAVIQ
jgi:hypothetical protein